MKFNRSFAAGLVIGILVAVGADVALLAWMTHKVKQSTRIDLFTPVGQLPPPMFPDASQVHVYGVPDPNWTFRSLDGKSVKLADFRGKIVFLHFWASWCSPCREELPYLLRLKERSRKLPVSIVLLSEEDPSQS